jgi:hypothetical protein
MKGRKLEIVNEITYSVIKLESTMCWRRQKARITTIGNYSQIAIDMGLTIMSNMRVSMLHQIYQMKCESSMLNGAEIGETEGRFGNGGRNTEEVQQESAKNP